MIDYWTLLEEPEPAIWPGATAWRDAWGSSGALPDPQGYGATVRRTRVPPDQLPAFWQCIVDRYPKLPRFSIGPRDTPGLGAFLETRGYRCERQETVMVLTRERFAPLLAHPLLPRVREVQTTDDLYQVRLLDQLVFQDPLPDAHRLQVALRGLGDRERLFFIPGQSMAQATGSVTLYDTWGLLANAETHPACRGQGLYHAILAARLTVLSAHPGVRFAAVWADDATSAPILRRAEFSAIGTVRVYRPPGRDDSG